MGKKHTKTTAQVMDKTRIGTKMSSQRPRTMTSPSFSEVSAGDTATRMTWTMREYPASATRVTQKMLSVIPQRLRGTETTTCAG
jgi:hypothetical protein